MTAAFVALHAHRLHLFDERVRVLVPVALDRGLGKCVCEGRLDVRIKDGHNHSWRHVRRQFIANIVENGRICRRRLCRHDRIENGDTLRVKRRETKTYQNVSGLNESDFPLTRCGCTACTTITW